MKKVLIGLLILTTGLMFAGCGQKGKTPEPQKAKPTKTITIGVMPDFESTPFVIAEKNGYFKQEGVNVKIEHFKSARDRDSALQSGRLDGVVTDVLAVVFANEGGIQLKMVSKDDGNIELIAGKDSGIKSTKDLKGKRLGLSTNTIMEYTADTMLTVAGLKSEDAKKEAIPQLPTRMEMLQGGKIDAAILPEPLAGMAIKDGAVVLNSTDQMANKAGAIAFTGKVLQENPDEVKAVMRAYNKAGEYMNKEPAAGYIDYVIQAQGFPPGIKNFAKLPKYNPSTAPDSKIVADVVKWMQDKKLIKGSYEYKDLVDDQILR